MKELGLPDCRETGRSLNKLLENSPEPFRRQLPPDAIAPEVRRGPFINTQPVQRGAHPLQPGRLQGQPHRRSRGVVRSLRLIRDSSPALTETSSHLSEAPGQPLCLRGRIDVCQDDANLDDIALDPRAADQGPHLYRNFARHPPVHGQYPRYGSQGDHVHLRDRCHPGLDKGQQANTQGNAATGTPKPPSFAGFGTLWNRLFRRRHNDQQ